MASDGIFLDSKYWFNKAQQASEPSEKINLLTTALKISPTYIEALNNRASAYKDLGDFDKALSDYQKMLEIQPSNVYAYRNRALLYQQLRRFDEALQDIKRLLKIDSTMSDGYAMYAQIMDLRRQESEALRAVEKSLEYDSTNWRALEVRIKIRYRQRDYESVLGDIEKSLSFSPDTYYPLLEMKATCLGRLKRYDDAIAIGKVLAIEYTERKEYAYYNMACWYALKNDSENALKNLEEAFRHGYKEFNHTKNDTDFKSIRQTQEFSSLISKYEPK